MKNKLSKKWFLRISLPIIVTSLIASFVVSFVVIKPKYSSNISLMPVRTEGSRIFSAFELGEICEVARSKEIYDSVIYTLNDIGISLSYKTVQKDLYSDYIGTSTFIKLFARHTNSDETKVVVTVYRDIVLDYYNKYAEQKELGNRLTIFGEASEPLKVNNNRIQYLFGIMLFGAALGLVGGGYATCLEDRKVKKNGK